MQKRLMRAATAVALLVALAACESGSPKSKASQSNTSGQPTTASTASQTTQTERPSSAPNTQSATPSTGGDSPTKDQATPSSPAPNASSQDASSDSPSTSTTLSDDDDETPSTSPSSEPLGTFNKEVECKAVGNAKSPVAKARLHGSGIQFTATFIFAEDSDASSDSLGYTMTIEGENGVSGVIKAGYLNGRKVFPLEDDRYVTTTSTYLSIVQPYTDIQGISRPFNWYAEVKDSDNTIATCGSKTSPVSVS